MLSPRWEYRKDCQGILAAQALGEMGVSVISDFWGLRSAELEVDGCRMQNMQEIKGLWKRGGGEE